MGTATQTKSVNVRSLGQYSVPLTDEVVDVEVEFKYYFELRFGRLKVIPLGYIFKQEIPGYWIAGIIKRIGPKAFEIALGEARKRHNQVREAQPWAK